MHKFDGLGTTHFTCGDEAGHMESMKLRVHHITLKKINGRVCLFYKEFMRDQDLLPKGGRGWPVFKDNSDLDLRQVTVMPTKPIAQLEDVERRLKVRALRARILENTSTAC